MELPEFLAQTQAQVRSEISDREGTPGGAYPYPESVFAEVVMNHMADVGMTFDPQVCHLQARVGNANLKLSGYAISEDADQLDLFVSLYDGVDAVTPVSDGDTKNAAEQCLRFLARCADGKLARQIDESNDAHALAVTIEGCYANLEQIRIYVLTDRLAKSKNFKAREVSGRTVKLEVMDIERLHRHWSEGKPRDELVVNFEEICGGPLPCVYVPGDA
ncbi:MAG: abortive phage infection protein, partial [Dehalococcoidia bacterium]|nr:abortive phage infection protein [Dehalococcoidia bacterium]